MTQEAAAQDRCPTVYLHIGTPKSGTTYLQRLLGRNRKRLAAQGVLWPGRTWVDQVHAVRDLANIHPFDHRSADVAGAWQRLVDEIHSWQGHSAVVSMEWLVDAKPRHIRRAIETLAPAQVHVVVTARDLARNIPADWQEDTQNWSTCGWQDYLAAVRNPESAAIDTGRRLWGQQDVGAILRRWGKVVPAERLHVVTVPPQGTDPQVLWQRFASVIGIDAEGFGTPPKTSNASLGVVSAELMRRINTLGHERGLGWKASGRILKQVFAKRVLTKRKSQEPALALPEDLYPWAIEQGKRLATEVEETGAHVWGDLAELIPDPANAREGITPDEVTDSELLEAALEGIVGLVGEVNRMLEAGQDNNTAPSQTSKPPFRLSTATETAKLALLRRARRGGLAGALHRGWRAARYRVRATQRRITRPSR